MTLARGATTPGVGRTDRALPRLRRRGPGNTRSVACGRGGRRGVPRRRDRRRHRSVRGRARGRAASRVDPPPALFDVDDAFDWVVAHVPDDVAATLTARRRAPHPRVPGRVLQAQGCVGERLDRVPAGHRRDRRRRDGRLHPRTVRGDRRGRTSPSRSTASSRPSSPTSARSAPIGPAAGDARRRRRPEPDVPPTTGSRTPRRRCGTSFGTRERRWSTHA